MKSLQKLAFILFLVFGFQSCMSPLTEKDNGRTIELEDESSFEINLEAEQGMVWEVVNYDESLIKTPQTEVTETTDKSGKPIKNFLFTFDTHGSGESVITIVYLEENDSTDFPHKTFEVKIICGTMGRIESD
jgi:predicted secreted protein